MENNSYIEFREVSDDLKDADLQVYFLGMHVHTIKNAWSRPGGHVYTEQEMCVKRAQRAVQRLWDQAEETR